MTDQPKPPLWRVMDDAYDKSLKAGTWKWGVTRAAEIRALADWLVPEEARPDPNIVQAGGTRMYYIQRFVEWYNRQELRRRLLAEADRAEAGE